ncbi:glutamate receptor-interacting protein 2 [Caerostris extrusa]|uniref:Glutamate receptor-interacting protein 2 n=1 Tax=Caerostris extrusa TaxID=172846 RepID=A0AAV4PAQ7_CAEEX|nr:glutamate receptor-interacting protein 2 [Caerostris extrusa]
MLKIISFSGIDKNSRPRISNLRPGSIAHRCDALVIGDYIISVNGIRTCKLRHEEIVNLLKNAGSKVTLEIEYEIPVCIKNLGLLIITHIRFGGPADRTGILKTGDRLLGIDGINLSSASVKEALQYLKQMQSKNATGPLLVEIDRTPGCLLGINLSCLSVPEHAIVIESIRQASIAERCGALHVGDHVLAIDGIKVDLMTSAEAMQLLRSTGETIKLEILPVSQIALKPSI